MAEYITLPIETDPEALAQDAIEWLTDNIPGWQANPTALDVIMIEALARMAAEGRDVASDVPKAVFRYYGNYVVGIPPIDATQASSTVTITVKDTAGYTIEAGTLIGIALNGDTVIPFELPDDAVVLPGATTVTGVTILAQEPGADGTGLTDDPEPFDIDDRIIGITLDAPTAGGLDAEDDDTYLNRLSTRLQLMSSQPILPRDFEVLSQDNAAVWRALALDTYNPGSATYGNIFTETVALIAQDGSNVGSTALAQVLADLNARRGINWNIFTINPTRTNLTVSYSAKCYADFLPAEVKAAVDNAIATWLSAANWGLPSYGDRRIWINTPTVYINDLIATIHSVEGVSRVITATINGGTTDLALTGAAPLPGVLTLDGARSVAL